MVVMMVVSPPLFAFPWVPSRFHRTFERTKSDQTTQIFSPDHISILFSFPAATHSLHRTLRHTHHELGHDAAPPPPHLASTFGFPENPGTCANPPWKSLLPTDFRCELPLRPVRGSAKRCDSIRTGSVKARLQLYNRKIGCCLRQLARGHAMLSGG